MDDLRYVIAKNITELRRSHRMTQAELAEKLSYTDKAISKWERGESIPDVAVLKTIASLFGVTVDYLLESNHEVKPGEMSHTRFINKMKNRAFITAMSVLLVWLLTTFAFIMVEYLDRDSFPHLIMFMYTVPASIVVWLIFNQLWFNRRRNFLIISCLMWSALICVLVSLFVWGIDGWRVLTLGIPGQFIICLWSRITKPKKPRASAVDSDKK